MDGWKVCCIDNLVLACSRAGRKECIDRVCYTIANRVMCSLLTWLWHAVSQEGVHDAGPDISPHTRCLDDQSVFKGQRTQSYSVMGG